MKLLIGLVVRECITPARPSARLLLIMQIVRVHRYQTVLVADTFGEWMSQVSAQRVGGGMKMGAICPFNMMALHSPLNLNAQTKPIQIQ